MRVAAFFRDPVPMMRRSDKLAHHAGDGMVNDVNQGPLLRERLVPTGMADGEQNRALHFHEGVENHINRALISGEISAAAAYAPMIIG